MSAHDRRYCKAPGCLASIPSDHDTHEAILARKGRVGEPLTSHAFGVCSPECWDRWDSAEDLARIKRWVRQAK